MKVGTIIQFEDGRFGTMVYNGLDGVGIIWGEEYLSQDDINAIKGVNPVVGEFPDFPKRLQPQALLRKPFKYADLPCIDMGYETYYVPEEDV